MRNSKPYLTWYLPHDTFKFIYTFFTACFTTVFVEFFSRHSITDSMDWFFEHPSLFLWNVVILFFLFVSFSIFRTKWFVFLTFTLSFLMIMIAFASGIKVEKTGKAFVPTDLILLNESFDMAKTYVSTQLVFVGFVSVLLSFLFLSFILKRVRNEKIFTLISIISTFMSFLLLFQFIFTDRGYLLFQKAGSKKEFWSSFVNVQKNGFILGTSLQMNSLFLAKPEQYSKEQIQKIKNKYPSTPPDSSISVNPNVVFLQLEAFFDPTTLPNSSFSSDPLPFFHSLQKQYQNGMLDVNVFGGGTVNTEFEILTSYHTAFFQEGSVPFLTHFRKPVISAASRFEKEGYTTSGIHNNGKWFYGREDVYPNLGFDRFIGREDMEESLSDEEKSAYLLKDNVLFDFIQNTMSSTSQKDFVYGISMATHGPYPDSDSNSLPIQLSKSTLSQPAKNIVTYYTNTLSELDKSLEAFLSSLKQFDEPTIVVLYGDHLPWLGDEYLAYKESGFALDEQTLHETPILFWSNDERFKNRQSNFHIGTSFLMPYLTSELGFEQETLYSFLNHQMKQDVRTLHSLQSSKKYGWDIQSIETYNLLQYDALQGEHFLKKP